jgi:hypothetical protein
MLGGHKRPNLEKPSVEKPQWKNLSGKTSVEKLHWETPRFFKDCHLKLWPLEMGF